MGGMNVRGLMSMVLMFHNISIIFYDEEKKEENQKRWLHLPRSVKCFFFHPKNGEIFIISHLLCSRSCIILIIIEKWFLFNLLGLFWECWLKWREKGARCEASTQIFHPFGTLRVPLNKHWFLNGKRLLMALFCYMNI